MRELASFAGMVAVMLFTLPLALGLVWLSLVGAFHVLPSSLRRMPAVAPMASEAGRAWLVVAHSKKLP